MESTVQNRIEIIQDEIAKIRERLADLTRLEESFEEWVRRSQEIIKEESANPVDLDESFERLLSNSSSGSSDNASEYEYSSDVSGEFPESETDGDWIEPPNMKKYRQAKPAKSVITVQLKPKRGVQHFQTIPGAVDRNGQPLTMASSIRALFDARPDVLHAFFYPTSHPENYLEVKTSDMPESRTLTTSMMQDLQAEHHVRFVYRERNKPIFPFTPLAATTAARQAYATVGMMSNANPLRQNAVRANQVVANGVPAASGNRIATVIGTMGRSPGAQTVATKVATPPASMHLQAPVGTSGLSAAQARVTESLLAASIRSAPAPAQTQNHVVAPAPAQTQAPSVGSAPAPAQTHVVAPVPAQTQAPSVASAPAPTQTQTAAPALGQARIPAVPSTPAPAETQPRVLGTLASPTPVQDASQTQAGASPKTPISELSMTILARANDEKRTQSPSPSVQQISRILASSVSPAPQSPLPPPPQSHPSIFRYLPSAPPAAEHLTTDTNTDQAPPQPPVDVSSSDEFFGTDLLPPPLPDTNKRRSFEDTDAQSPLITPRNVHAPLHSSGLIAVENPAPEDITLDVFGVCQHPGFDAPLTTTPLDSWLFTTRPFQTPKFS